MEPDVTIPAALDHNNDTIGYFKAIPTPAGSFLHFTPYTDKEVWVYDPGRPGCGLAGNGVPTKDLPVPAAAQGALLFAIMREGEILPEAWVPWLATDTEKIFSGPIWQVVFRMNDDNVSDNIGYVRLFATISSASSHLDSGFLKPLSSRTTRIRRKLGDPKGGIIKRGATHDTYCGLLKWVEDANGASLFDEIANGCLTIFLYNDDGSFASSITHECVAGKQVWVDLPYSFGCYC